MIITCTFNKGLSGILLGSRYFPFPLSSENPGVQFSNYDRIDFLKKSVRKDTDLLKGVDKFLFSGGDTLSLVQIRVGHLA